MMYEIGTKLKCKGDGQAFVVTGSTDRFTRYSGPGASGECPTPMVAELFSVESASALNTQEGGDHYRKLGAYQPWKVLRQWLTPEEFRGYMKGTAIAYLAREQDKGGMLDIRKAGHTLQGLVELLEVE